MLHHFENLRPSVFRIRKPTACCPNYVLLRRILTIKLYRNVLRKYKNKLRSKDLWSFFHKATMSCVVSLETRNSKLSNALEHTSTWITHTGNGATKQSNFTFYSQTDINLYSCQSISPKRRITIQMMKIVFFFLYCISIVISMVK